MEKTMMLAFCAVYNFTYMDGIAILDPTYHEYEDAFADGKVKAVFFSKDTATCVKTSTLKYSAKGVYFVKYGRRYYLDDFMRCDVCGVVTPHKYQLIKF